MVGLLHPDMGSTIGGAARRPGVLPAILQGLQPTALLWSEQVMSRIHAIAVAQAEGQGTLVGNVTHNESM